MMIAAYEKKGPGLKRVLKKCLPKQKTYLSG